MNPPIWVGYPPFKQIVTESGNLRNEVGLILDELSEESLRTISSQSYYQTGN